GRKVRRGLWGGRVWRRVWGISGRRLWWVPWRPPVALFGVPKCVSIYAALPDRKALRGSAECKQRSRRVQDVDRLGEVAMHERSQNRMRFIKNDLLRAWTFLHSDSNLNIPVSRLVLVILALTVIAFPPLRATAGDSIEERRARIRSMASETLQSLYKLQPGSRAVVDGAAGYAVFDNTGFHIVLPTTAKRTGIAVDSKTGSETFMKMRSESGRGSTAVEDCRMVFVFETRRAFDQF